MTHLFTLFTLDNLLFFCSSMVFTVWVSVVPGCLVRNPTPAWCGITLSDQGIQGQELPFTFKEVTLRKLHGMDHQIPDGNRAHRGWKSPRLLGSCPRGRGRVQPGGLGGGGVSVLSRVPGTTGFSVWVSKG